MCYVFSIEKHQSTFILFHYRQLMFSLLLYMTSVIMSTCVATHRFNQLIFHDESVVLMNVALLPVLKETHRNIQTATVRQ